MFDQFSYTQLALIAVIFIWTGFVRSGLGFGGAALGLPLLLFLDDRPVYWLPIIGCHLLFFSGLTLRTRMHNVEWQFLQRAAVYVLPAAIIGVLGLLNLPNQWLVIFIYSVTIFYGVMWLMNLELSSKSPWLDRLLLILGGYVAGTSLSGAPLMVAVFMRNIPFHQLRNTLFVLWFVLVSIKMLTFVLLKVELHLLTAAFLIPVASIGHVLGLRAHDRILENDQLFKRVIGAVLIIVCILGLLRIQTV
jgi:uncharacterized membrane protein YfcA